MSQVSLHRTPYDPATVAGAMVWAYKRVTGHAPLSRTSWLYPLAQSAIETAHWTAMFNNNAGNVTTANPSSEAWMFEPGNGLRFRAYDTLGDGCLSMLKWLASHGVLAHADAGDAPGYLAALKAGCYAGCGVDYPSIDGYVAQYQHLRPRVYWNLPPWGTFALAAGVLLSTGAIAYYIAEGELPTPRRVLARI